jgi:serine acetyltransferase
VLGASVLVGCGAQILQYLLIGSGATIGAGAVVTRNVPDGATVVGIPARPQNAARTQLSFTQSARSEQNIILQKESD